MIFTHHHLENLQVMHLHITGSFTCIETTAKVLVCDEMIELKEKVLKLENDNKELKKMVKEMYYAPGMPGYELAKIDFENLQKNAS